MSDSASLPLPNPEPLFTLDLGDNGGRLAPTTVLELTQWIQKAQQFWSWANQRNYGNHEQGFRQAFDQFNHALTTPTSHSSTLRRIRSRPRTAWKAARPKSRRHWSGASCPTAQHHWPNASTPTGRMSETKPRASCLLSMFRQTRVINSSPMT